MLNKLNFDNQALYPILLLAFVFFTFSITDLLKGNGYLAVYIAGIMVGNNKIMHRKDIYTFMDGLTWLFQIIMFLCLGLLVNPHEMLEEADTLKDMNLPKGTLVMIVKRGDEFLIPNGTLKLHVNDKLLLISEKSKEEEENSSES